MGTKALLIGEVADQAGVSAPTIRYYERIGLLAGPPRSTAGYRRYAERTVTEVRFVRKAQALGFTLEEVAEILQLSRSGHTPCAHVLSLTRRHLAAVEARIARLQEFRSYLATELKKWAKQKTVTSCDGLCQFIADAAPAPGPDPPEAPAAGRRPRRRHAGDRHP